MEGIAWSLLVFGTIDRAGALWGLLVGFVGVFILGHLQAYLVGIWVTISDNEFVVSYRGSGEDVALKIESILEIVYLRFSTPKKAALKVCHSEGEALIIGPWAEWQGEAKVEKLIKQLNKRGKNLPIPPNVEDVGTIKEFMAERRRTRTLSGISSPPNGRAKLQGGVDATHFDSSVD